MSHRTPNRPWRRLLAVTAAAGIMAWTAPPASALDLSWLLGGSPTEGDGGAGAGAQTSDASSAPPAGGTAVEAETLAGGTVVTSTGASGGALLRTASTQTAPAASSGHRTLTIRAMASSGAGRLALTVDGDVVGAHTVGAGWELVDAVALVPAGAAVGVVAQALPGASTPVQIDVDWIHVAETAPGFTTAGNRILDPSGGRFVARGMTAPGHQAPRSVDGVLELPPSFAGEQHAWGLPVVRLPLNQEHWLADCPTVRAGVPVGGYREAVAGEVEALTSRGMVAILTLTRTERGKATGCAPAALPVFKEMADRRSPAFWRSVAERFSSNPAVLFDLFNEPYKITDAIWRDGGTVTYTFKGRQHTYEAVGMQDLYDAVRGTGAENVVLVSGQRWASDPRVVRKQPLDGYGIVLAAHTYCHGCSPPQLHAKIDTLLDPALLATHPVMVSETGWVDPTSSSYHRQFLDWAAARGIGWTLYGWGHPSAAYTLLSGWAPASYPVADGTNTFPPSASGVPLWNELADVRVARGHRAVPIAETG